MVRTKEDVLWGCKTMCARGYVLGTSGNISARAEGGSRFVITPTSLPYDELTAADLVTADMSGTVVEGRRAPSVEITMHREIYRRRPDVTAIVHTHSAYATAAGALRGITCVPLVDIEAAIYLGGDIAIAPFAPPGSLDLAVKAASSLGACAGVILESHGAVGVGRSMRAAMVASDIVERTCQIFMAVAAAGKLKALPEEYLAACREESARARGVADL